MKERGVALITAIVLVAIATMLAVHIGTRAALDLRRTAGLLALDQGWHVALGAEAWAAEVLRDDIEDSPEQDHLAEAWAQPLPPLPVDGGELRGALEDMQGRFNLNNLVDSSRQVNEDAVRQFERLLVLVGAEPRWGNIMVDWIDEGSIQQYPEGAEDGTYLSQNPPYRAANVLVTTTTEMMALPGMTREEFDRIRPYVAALPVGTSINLCTARPQVLATLVEGGADFGDEELLTANRKEGCYPTKEFLPSLIGDVKANELVSANIVSETSDWFRATTAVRIGTSELTLYSLIHRNGTTGIRTVLRSTGTE
jgi:general secretion pathway protein K